MPHHRACVPACLPPPPPRRPVVFVLGMGCSSSRHNSSIVLVLSRSLCGCVMYGLHPFARRIIVIVIICLINYYLLLLPLLLLGAFPKPRPQQPRTYPTRQFRRPSSLPPYPHAHKHIQRCPNPPPCGGLSSRLVTHFLAHTEKRVPRFQSKKTQSNLHSSESAKDPLPRPSPQSKFAYEKTTTRAAPSRKGKKLRRRQFTNQPGHIHAPANRAGPEPPFPPHNSPATATNPKSHPKPKTQTPHMRAAGRT